MSWEQRSYSQEPQYRDGSGGSGLRSWVGGLQPPTKAVKWIIIANVAMFLLCQFTGRGGSPIYQWLLMNTYEVVHHFQIWRLFTFTYLHDQGSLFHVFFNMLGLYFLGVPLERHWGPKRFFTFYTLGGFVAVLLYLIATLIPGGLDSRTELVGASGGVFAVLGACAVLFPQFQLILLFFPVPIRAAALLFVIFFSFNLFNQGANAGGDACHLAGLGFGIYWAYRGQGLMERWETWRANARQGAWEARRRHELDIEGQLDRILEKVKREGMQSLSRGDKKLLEEATRRKQGIRS